MFVINEEYKIGNRIFSAPVILVEDADLANTIVKAKNILAKEREPRNNYSLKKLEVASPMKDQETGVQVIRSGEAFSIASCAYLAIMPNGDLTPIWSPPWNEFTPEEEDLGALKAAVNLWKKGEYFKIGEDHLE